MTDSRYPPISNSVVPVGEHKVLLVLKLQADVLPTGHESRKGYAPPGTCTLIPLENTPCYPNTHSCRFMALCPTMRVPGNVNWNREVVYNCIWSLLNVLSQHNSRSISGISDNDSNKRAEEAKIKSVLITGLATGVGGISAEKCAKQMAMAFADFNDASLNEEKWSSFNWDTALNYANACRDTYDLNAEHGDD